VGFAIMSVFASTHDTFPGDVWLAHRIQDINIAGVDEALDWAEDAADLPVVALVCAALAALLLLARDGLGALIVAVAVPGRVLITWVLKELIERPRPSADILDFESQPETFAFPSGHAGAAFVLYGLIFYFSTLYIRDLRQRLPVQAACVVIILLVGAERVYVGHHWPSDVIGGYYVGALIVAAFIALHQISRRVTSNLPLQRSFTRATSTPEPE
jgi:undecaprenyl-diphosphatase